MPHVRTLAFAVLVAMLRTAAPAAEQVVESPREIPLLGDVDVVVVGGSTGAVAAACEAASQKARVFLVADRPYLGTDLCATLRLWLEDGERPSDPLAVAVFGDQRVTTPWKVKAAMDRALLAANVRYLTGCYATDVLRDGQGQLAGIVVANRSGRQAIRAKVIVDATPQAIVARQAGVAMRPFRPGPHTFTRVVAGGPAAEGEKLSVEKKDLTYNAVIGKSKLRLPVYRYTLTIDMKDDRVADWMDAENRARDMTATREAEMGAEVLTGRAADSIVGRRRLAAWPEPETADLGPFQPEGVERLYVLGPRADLSPEAAPALDRPLTLIALGRRIGRAAAEEAKRTAPLAGVRLPGCDTDADILGDVRENLTALRSERRQTIRCGRCVLPVLGRYDVVVVGGGTSGAPAAIGAARSGARTLVVEYLHELGGVGTAGLIAKYWYGLRGGFTEYVDGRVNPGRDEWSAVWKAEWLRREIRSLGADVWFGVLGCGAVVDRGRVRGVVLATPWGRGVVLADAVIDATGNADVAASAGAAARYSLSELGSLNVQIAGFPERPIGRSYRNTCYTMVDDTDVLDVWHLMVWKRTASTRPEAFDVGQLVDSRERRRIVGDYTLTVEDILNARTFPDTISRHFSNFDAAAFPDSPLLLAADAKGPRFETDLPYRCLLPKDLDGILVVGLGTSAERDATTLIRMQPDLQNQGYAAGVAAAEVARCGGRTRSVDLKKVQKQLVVEGVLPARVLTDVDSYPMPAEKIEAAVRSIASPDAAVVLSGLAVVMAQRRAAIPLLEAAYRDTKTDEARLRYARVLGILGNATGAPTLIAAIDAQQGWDQGAALTSQRATGNTFSALDRDVIALGLSRSPAGTGPLLAKLGQLTPDSEMSHYKAIALALHDCRERVAKVSLVKLLDSPGFTGHATPSPLADAGSDGAQRAALADRFVTVGPDRQANEMNLNKALKELIVASMLYRCGDRDGRGQAILRRYAQDIHGHLATYARHALDARLPPRQQAD